MNNNLRTIIETYKLNTDEALLQNYKYLHNGKTGYYDSFDANYWRRKDLIFELYNDYNVDDKPLIKWLLSQEAIGFKDSIPVYTNDVCAFMLYKHMELDDIYDLFNAKFLGTDNSFYLDIELIFGFDREETKNYFRNKKTNKKFNKEIIKVIESYESNPNAKFKNREEYIRYFENKKIKIICSDLESVSK